MGRLQLALVLALASGPAPVHAANLLVNGDFDDPPAEGWQCTPTARCSHDELDVDGDASSGSALLSAEPASPGSSVVLAQCVAVVPDRSYDFTGWARVSEANPVTTILRLRMAWYSGAGCTGSLIHSEVLAAAGEIGVWTPLARTRPSPPNAASGRFDVQFLKSPSVPGGATARVDALSVPEPAAGAGALAALATLGAHARRRAAPSA